MKLFKLIVHHKNFSGEDLIINPKDFPGIKKGSIVEIYHPEDEFSRLLLQITVLKEDLQGKDTISVEQSIANAFQLRTYADVYMNIVNPEDVALDSVELTFKDQYMGRLHQEKNGSNHEVTIVLFSRTFYKANNLEEFPGYMRECLQQDYKGRFYEDFYRVAVQNERYDDWTNTLVQLRRLFTDYQKIVLEYHKRPGKHYLDRSFDRTGQLSVVITPGVGVFEVDRELTNVTKQRIIDNGVGSDLVCVGEQPLHAVPLLKFHNKDTSFSAADDYSMPHWINLRFSRSLQRMNSRNKKTSTSAVDSQSDSSQKFLKRKMSDPDIHHSLSNVGSPTGSSAPRSAAISIPHRTNEISPQQSVSIGQNNTESVKHRAFNIQNEILENETSPPYRPVVGSAGSPSNPLQTQATSILRPGRALINPFDPSHVTIKLTSNRRRWTHIFPKGPTGVLIQQHHYQAVPALSNTEQQGFDGGSTYSTSPGNENSAPIGSLPRSISQIAFHDSVDWKSLTIPACLPITTDYFPDKRSLQNDYLVSDYNLLPDDVNADFAQQRAIYKKPLTTAEVFRELVSQRLAQGFQLIVLNENNSKKQAQTPGSNSTSATAGIISSLVMSRPRDIEPTEEYFLSIGRVFHKISLSGSAITVTRYRPRHPYPPFNIHYRYRFHAPHHDTYEVSWVSFTTEKLENFNWNYLDHYICTRGDTDFQLAEAQKYWRFRVYLLPLNHHATKKILDGAEHCDIYCPPTPEEQGHQVETFLRFLETWVNRIKRPNTCKKPRNPAPSTGSKAQQKLILRRHSTSLIYLSSHSNSSGSSSISSTNFQTSVVGNSPFRERLGSNRVVDKPRPRSGSKVMERVKTDGGSGGSGHVSPASEATVGENRATTQQPASPDQQTQQQPPQQQQPPPSQQQSVDAPHHQDSADERQVDREQSQGHSDINRLKSTATLTEIRDAMRNNLTGVGFLTDHPSLPSFTFVSADAVQWIISHVDDITNEEQAVELMEVEGESILQPLGDLQSFENEWLEVEVNHPTNWKQSGPTSPNSEMSVAVPTIPKFLCSPLEEICLEAGETEREWTVPLYKHTHLEIDVNGKSDRIEWGHARYQSLYRPDRAWELVVQWVTSSGTIVAELIMGWSRKAQTCGLQMIPIPSDPLALPFTHKSDPLRGPIFIPLDIECLMGNKSYLFEEESWDQRLFLFQESIVERFGFMRCTVDSSISSPTSNVNATGSLAHQHQYIHLTGNMFILIPSQPCHMGFLWSWNHMVSRRWKSAATSATGDEMFQTKILKDFREFCANYDNRLKQFWDLCWTLREHPS
ncbi:DEP domain-containing protein 5 [Blattella germanica]|nr:DEP domain-containing protein 5 [Blattella germanica]